ncbi:hypothetical protein BSL78_01185 [Apostichopus japonicus]|uniref:Uncharacterized protein n=1 Tax=Stichopus japonicus TaxID=307972 RepID=A0A2G8LNP6_STIJA|nr:hypothetical protein BSL78_01185 [Apostichopus japonicus]
MTEESSQEFLKDVTDIFENTVTPQTASDGPERIVNVAKNVEASVMSSDISSSSFKLSSFILGEQAPEDDASLLINSSSPPPNDDQGFRWGFSEITEANGRPDVEMTQLHHINNHDTSEEDFVKDPFSSSYLHASNILTYPSDLQSPASNGTDLLKPSFDSQLHNKPKRQSHYWRQPLASSLVRRRPPSPSLICASSYRDELHQEDSSQLYPEKQNINMSDNLAEALYSNKDDFGERFDMNEQYRPGFDGCKSFGDWRRLEPNKQGNLLEEEENHMRQHSHQNERNFINEDIDQQLGFDRCDSSLNWKRQDLIESLDSLEKVNHSQQPRYHSEGKLIKDDISETQRYGFDRPKSFTGWRRLEFNEPLNTLEKVNHIPQLMYRNKQNLSKNQEFMSPSSQHRVPSMEKQDASRSIDELFPLVNEDCMPLESVIITSRDTDCHAQRLDRDKGILNTEETYQNLAFKSQDQMSSHTVSTKQFIERRVPEWNSSNISTSFNKTNWANGYTAISDIIIHASPQGNVTHHRPSR